MWLLWLMEKLALRYKRLVQMGDRVVRLYLHREESQKFADEIIKNSAVEIESVFTAECLQDEDHICKLESDAPDYLITVYWSHLLTPGY